jgi:hypothetical protein
MKKSLQFALISAALGWVSATASAADVDCLKLALAVKAAASDSSALLSLVEREVAANPACACEVVKAAIEGSKAEAALVASIVETASTAAPEMMRLISQCAVAVAPDAIGDVQAVMAKLDPNRGETVDSGAKDAKDAETGPAAVSGLPNPLDFPGQAPGDPPVIVGFNPGGPGGFPMIPPGPPSMIPPVILPPTATQP